MTRNNVFNLLIALIISVSLWGYVISEVNPPTELHFSGIKINFEGMEEVNNRGLVLVSSSAVYAEVTIEGKRSDTSKVSKDEIEVTANITGLQKGSHEIALEYNIPGSVDISYMSVENVSIYLDNVVTVSKPVSIAVSGETESGEVHIIESNKTDVYVTGAECNVAKVDHVAGVLDAGDVGDEAETFTLSLKPVDANGNFVSDVTVAETSVEARAVIVSTKTVPLKVDIKNPEDDRYQRSYKCPETVVIGGAAGLLADIEEIKAEGIDLSGITEDSVVKITPILPDNVYLSDDYGDEGLTMDVEVIGFSEKEYSFDTDDIELTGVPEGAAAEIKDGKIKLTAVGTKKQLKGLEKADFKLSADLTGLEEGAHEVELVYSLSESKEVKEVEISPQKIKVNITFEEE